jgi:hypothetical protein
LIPGCLIGESEERETWTAESLRALPRSKSDLREGWGRKRLRRSTFQVNTLSGKRQACARCKSGVRSALIGKRGTSSNVVISREKFSSNLRV